MFKIIASQCHGTAQVAYAVTYAYASMLVHSFNISYGYATEVTVLKISGVFEILPLMEGNIFS